MAGTRLKIVLKWIKILDSLDVGSDEGQFRFLARVTADGASHEYRFPETGHYPLSAAPGHNFVNFFDKVLWEGEVSGDMTFELLGEEVDRISANDPLDHYSRAFSGDPSSWIKKYEPMDEGVNDPENMTNWRIAYRIEPA